MRWRDSQRWIAWQNSYHPTIPPVSFILPSLIFYYMHLLPILHTVNLPRFPTFKTQNTTIYRYPTPSHPLPLLNHLPFSHNTLPPPISIPILSNHTFSPHFSTHHHSSPFLTNASTSNLFLDSTPSFHESHSFHPSFHRFSFIVSFFCMLLS